MKKLLILSLPLLLSVFFIQSCMKGDSVLPSENLPPDRPTNPFPADSATGINPESVTLSWTCSDPNWDDLTYTLVWRPSYNYWLADTISGLTTPEYTIQDLNYGCPYRWTVIAQDEHGEVHGSYGWIFYTEDTVVDFPDLSLELKIRQLLHRPSGVIYASDIYYFDYFTANHSGILDLTGIEYLCGLRQLSLEGNSLSVLSSLSSIAYLTRLDLDDNQITDIAALSNSHYLDALYLSHNQIADITPLSNANNMAQLHIDHNNINDISVLSNLTNMTYLDLEYNQVSDIEPLSGLTLLERLTLGNNQISDISPISESLFMERLDADSNLIADISSLSGLILLYYIDLTNNLITDISALSGLALLNDIKLSDNQITDVEPLVDNPGIQQGDHLYLYDNPLDSLSINVYIPELEARGVHVYY
jgi:hypothetical protein